ncbi:hypothetical protein Tco_0190399 [Tanacetum coccineum]
MASMKYCDKHNQVGFLKKPEESAGFAEIVDFLKGSHIRYALTHNPTIHDSLVKQFWQTATASTLADGTLELRATIDTLEYTITEASVRSKLQLADASGISMLPNTEIFEGMGNMGYPADGQADQAGTQSQPSSSTVPPPPTSQPAPPETTTIPPTPITEPTSEPSSPSTAPEHEPMEHPFEQPSPEHQPSSLRQASDIPQTQAPTHTHEAETGHITGFEDVSTDFTDIKSASEKVCSGGEHVSASQREGKAALEETPQTERTKKQIREEQASLAEISRIQAEEEAENARREELKRYVLNWKQMQIWSKRLQEKMYPRLIMLREWGGWKLAQIKKLIDEELKEKFEYLMRSMERFVPMDTEKESRKKELCRSSNRNFQEAKKRALNLQSTGTEEDVEADNGERVDESIFRRADDVEVMEISRPEENLKGVLMGGIKRLCIDPPSEEMIFGSVPHH